MSMVYAWVKNVVCFYIFLTVILHLLPRDNYRKYVRFFSGMLLMILVFSPVLSLLGKEDTLLQRISQAEFFQDMDSLKLDTAHLQRDQKALYLREYERAVGMDISRMAAEKQLDASQVEVHLSEEYQVESIAMEISKEGGEGIYRLKQELMEFYQVNEAQIEIRVSSE